jgi:hypothetical protein
VRTLGVIKELAERVKPVDNMTVIDAPIYRGQLEWGGGISSFHTSDLRSVDVAMPSFT